MRRTAARSRWKGKIDRSFSLASGPMFVNVIGFNAWPTPPDRTLRDPVPPSDRPRTRSRPRVFSRRFLLGSDLELVQQAVQVRAADGEFLRRLESVPRLSPQGRQDELALKRPHGFAKGPVRNLRRHRSALELVRQVADAHFWPIGQDQTSF